MEGEAAEKAPSECEALRLQLRLAETRLEAKANQMQHRETAAAAERAACETALAAAERERASVDEARAAAEKRAQAAAEERSVLQERLAAAQAELATIGDEKRRLLEAVAAKDVELQGAEAAAAAAREAAASSAAQMRAGADAADESEHQRIQAAFELARAQKETELAKQASTWLTQELESVRAEFGAYRKSAGAELSEAQGRAAAAEAALGQSETAGAQLQAKLGDVERQSEDQAARLKTLERAAEAKEASFLAEVEALRRVNELYKQRCADQEQLLADQQKLLGEAEQEVVARTARCDALEAELAAAQAAAAAAERQVEALLGENQAWKAHGPVPLTTQPTTSATALALELQQARGETLKERAEGDRLREMLAEILREVEEKSVEFQADRQRLAQALEDSRALREQLGAALQNRGETETRLERAQGRLQVLEGESADYRQQARDMALQVASLIRELDAIDSGRSTGTLTAAERDRLRSMATSARAVAVGSGSVSGGESLLGALEDGASVAGDAIPGSDVLSVCESAVDAGSVSERLVVFRNVDELQVQNVRLLQLVRRLRRLQDRQAAEFQRKMGKLESRHLSVAMDKVAALHRDMEAISRDAQVIKQERDEYKRRLRAVSSHGGSATPVPDILSTDSETLSQLNVAREALAAQKAEYADLARRFDESATTCRLMEEQQRQEQSRLFEATQELERLRKRVAYLEERNQQLLDAFEGREREVRALRDKLAATATTMAENDGKMQQLVNDLFAAREELHRAKLDVLNAKTERELWQAAEKRYESESQAHVRERRSLNELVQSLQTVQTRLEQQDAERGRKLAGRIEQLERQVQTAGDRLQEQVCETRRVQSEKELAAKEHASRLRTAQETVQRAREDLSAATARVGLLEQRVAELKASQSAAVESTKSEPSKVEPSGGERELQVELVEARGELRAMAAELEAAREHAARLGGIAASHEDALASLEAQMASVQAENARQQASLAEQLQQATARRDTLEEQLAKAVQEATELQAALDERDAAAAAAVTAAAANLEQAQARVNAAEEAVRNAEETAALHQTRARDAEQNYQRELVNHAADVAQLETLRGQLLTAQTSAQEQTHRAEAAQNELAASLETAAAQRAQLDKNATLLEQRCTDLASQNDLLHSQLQVLGQQVKRLHEPTAGDAPATEQPGSAEEELRGVIRFLRRDHEIQKCEAEMALQESVRLRAQLHQSEEALRATKLALGEERNRVQAALEANTRYGDLADKVTQLNILRESNTTLRDELSRSQRRTTQLEERCRELETELEPLREQTRNLEGDLEARALELDALRADNTRWKTRATQILQKYDRIDPAEHETLKEQVVALTADVGRAADEGERWKQRAQQLVAKLAQQKALSTQVEQLQQQVAELSASAADAVAQREQAELRLVAADEQAKKAAAELTTRWQERYRSATNHLSGWKERLAAKEAELGETQAALARMDSERVRLQQELVDVRQRLESELAARPVSADPAVKSQIKEAPTPASKRRYDEVKDESEQFADAPMELDAVTMPEAKRLRPAPEPLPEMAETLQESPVELESAPGTPLADLDVLAGESPAVLSPPASSPESVDDDESVELAGDSGFIGNVDLAEPVVESDNAESADGSPGDANVLFPDTPTGLTPAGTTPGDAEIEPFDDNAEEPAEVFVSEVQEPSAEPSLVPSTNASSFFDGSASEVIPGSLAEAAGSSGAGVQGEPVDVESQPAAPAQAVEVVEPLPVEQPAETPVESLPVEQPAETPVEKPAEKPVALAQPTQPIQPTEPSPQTQPMEQTQEQEAQDTPPKPAGRVIRLSKSSSSTKPGPPLTALGNRGQTPGGAKQKQPQPPPPQKQQQKPQQKQQQKQQKQQKQKQQQAAQPAQPPQQSQKEKQDQQALIQLQRERQRALLLQSMKARKEQKNAQSAGLSASAGASPDASGAGRGQRVAGRGRGRGGSS